MLLLELLLERAFLTNVWMVCKSEEPSRQLLPSAVLPPSPDAPELCGELEEVGDQELS